MGYQWTVEYLWFDLEYCDGGTLYEVELRGSDANVRLMTADEFGAYCDGEAYEYHGGFYDYTPVVVEVPHDGFWYLVVDAYRDRIKVRYTEVD